MHGHPPLIQLFILRIRHDSPEFERLSNMAGTSEKEEATSTKQLQLVTSQLSCRQIALQVCITFSLEKKVEKATQILF